MLKTYIITHRLKEVAQGKARNGADEKDVAFEAKQNKIAKTAQVCLKMCDSI